ncbi:MAG: type III-A CRISPR-associated protein Csm2 [Chloroflexi bacterium]|nr:type III-A CRISPR-associated protein Csm2 [Chloroflexota bacterium]
MTEPSARRSPPRSPGPRPPGPTRPTTEGRRPPEPLRPPDPNDLRAIIIAGNAQLTVQEAQRLARALAGERPEARQATSAALRVVWGELQRLRYAGGPIGRGLLLLKPKLAYLAGRVGSAGRGVADLQAALAPAIDLVEGDEQRFAHFCDFVEALLAYYAAGPHFSGR